MKTQNNSKKLIGTGVITAVAASLCCITPVLALISGASGIASSFSWMEPFRPYLIGITIVVLGFAWYQKLKPRTTEEIECACEADDKPSFWQSKKFLLMVTVFAGLMLTFPLYSNIFYPGKEKDVMVVSPANIEVIHMNIKGMTCESCNLHIEHTVLENDGVIDAKADFRTGEANITFDKSKVNEEKIIKSVNSTGYKVVKIKTKQWKLN